VAFDNVDCLDVSDKGTEAWDAACKRYLANSVLLMGAWFCYVFLFIRFSA